MCDELLYLVIEVEWEAALEVVDEGRHHGVLVVEEENLLSGDDGFDVLQVHHDGMLAPQDRRWIR